MGTLNRRGCAWGWRSRGPDRPSHVGGACRAHSMWPRSSERKDYRTRNRVDSGMVGSGSGGKIRTYDQAWPTIRVTPKRGGEPGTALVGCCAGVNYVALCSRSRPSVKR